MSILSMIISAFTLMLSQRKKKEGRKLDGFGSDVIFYRLLISGPESSRRTNMIQLTDMRFNDGIGANTIMGFTECYAPVNGPD